MTDRSWIFKILLGLLGIALGLLLGRRIFGPEEYRPNTPYAAGEDLDQTITGKKWVPKATTTSWPIPQGTRIPAGTLTLTAESECGGQNTVTDVCTFTLDPKSKICGAKALVDRIELLAVNASYADGGTSFGGNNALIACDTSYPEGGYPKPDVLPSWDKAGAIGKCIYWAKKGFVPSKNHEDRFRSCVRAVRSDYCGDGNSVRLAGTPIDLYDADHAPGKKLVEPDPYAAGWTIEALWTHDRAICVNAQLVTTTGCKDDYIVVVGDGGVLCVNNTNLKDAVLVTSIR